MRHLAGYGYAPERAIYWALGLIGGATLLYCLAWQAGVMVPNSDVILTSQDWTTAMGANWNAPSEAWGKLPPAIHYETFYSLPYAFETFVPLVDLGQESAWSASTVTSFGILVRWLTFALQIIGWIITALGAAAITGIIRRDRG